MKDSQDLQIIGVMTASFILIFGAVFILRPQVSEAETCGPSRFEDVATDSTMAISCLPPEGIED